VVYDAADYADSLRKQQSHRLAMRRSVGTRAVPNIRFDAE